MKHNGHVWTRSGYVQEEGVLMMQGRVEHLASLPGFNLFTCSGTLQARVWYPIPPMSSMVRTHMYGWIIPLSVRQPQRSYLHSYRSGGKAPPCMCCPMQQTTEFVGLFSAMLCEHFFGSCVRMWWGVSCFVCVDEVRVVDVLGLA